MSKTIIITSAALAYIFAIFLVCIGASFSIGYYYASIKTNDEFMNIIKAQNMQDGICYSINFEQNEEIEEEQ